MPSSPGRYEVVFNRDVSNCAYVASTSGGFVFHTGVDEGPSADSVVVYTAGDSGLEFLPFHLVVNC